MDASVLKASVVELFNGSIYSHENLKLYRQQLSEAKDDKKRRILRLLIEVLEQDKSFK
jgi:hypothetical protein